MCACVGVRTLKQIKGGLCDVAPVERHWDGALGVQAGQRPLQVACIAPHICPGLARVWCIGCSRSEYKCVSVVAVEEAPQRFFCKSVRVISSMPMP